MEDSPNNLHVRLLADPENPSPQEAAQLQKISYGSFTLAHGDESVSNHIGDKSPRDQPISPMSPHLKLIKKILSEFMGTFVLLFVGAGAGIVNQITGGSLTFLGCATAGGLSVMVIIFTIGHVSGAHINPSVSLAFASLGQLPWAEVPLYIIAQVLGGIAASFSLKAIFHSNMHNGMTLPQGGYTETFILEFMISCILMFVITSVVTDKSAENGMAAVAVGMTIIFNALIAGAISGGSMNPARSIGPAIAANDYTGLWLYIVAPTLGMQLGAGAYTLIRLQGPNTPPPKSAKSN